jgi:hypothetical protein
MIIYIIDGEPTSNTFDVRDAFPFRFLLSNELKLPSNCTKPLYFYNQMTMWTPIYKRNNYSLDKIWNSYDSSVWVTFLALIAFVSIISSQFSPNQTRYQIINSILASFWQHFLPLLRKGNSASRKSKNYIYCLYLFTFIPLIIVFENEFLAHLVSNQDVKLNTIDDFISRNKILLTTGQSHKKYVENEIKKLDERLDSEFVAKLNKFYANVRGVDDLDINELINNENTLKYFAERIVSMEDDYRMQWIKVNECKQLLEYNTFCI